MTIAIIGEPNIGKSTLFNRILGEKISIVTHKAQTTRSNLRGVWHNDDCELILVDTPGIFKPNGILERSITRAAWRGAQEADAVALLFDPRQQQLNENQQAIINGLRKRDKPIYCLINKIDLVEKPRLLQLIALLHEQVQAEDVLLLSGLKGDGVLQMLSFFQKMAPERPWLFGSDDITDAPLREIAAELTREKLFQRLHKELPYSLKVETEMWEDMPDGSIKIHQAITVLKESQKKIVIGQGASTIKAVGQSARRDISRLTGQHVHLFLHAKVKSDWIDTDAAL